MKLYTKIIIGMIAGILVGVMFGKTGFFMPRDRLTVIPDLGRKIGREEPDPPPPGERPGVAHSRPHRDRASARDR